MIEEFKHYRLQCDQCRCYLINAYGSNDFVDYEAMISLAKDDGWKKDWVVRSGAIRSPIYLCSDCAKGQKKGAEEMTQENLKERIIKSIDRRSKAYVRATAMTRHKIRKHVAFGIAVELEGLKNEIESMELKK